MTFLTPKRLGKYHLNKEDDILDVLQLGHEGSPVVLGPQQFHLHQEQQ
jgi:hypothetical protein